MSRALAVVALLLAGMFASPVRAQSEQGGLGGGAAYNVAGVAQGATGGGWQGFSPAWLAPKLWLAAGLGVTQVAGPVTATGTTPPTVTIAGTPSTAQFSAATPYVELDCTTLGAVTVSRFTVKVNGATTATNVASSLSAVALAGSGLTATWAAGASATNDVYTANAVASGWADQSGQANNATQATASKEPIYCATDATYGGAATMTFASTGSQVMTLAKLFPNQPFTILVVGASTSGATNQAFVGDGNPTTMYFATSSYALFAGSNLTAGNAVRTKQAFAGVFNGTNSTFYVQSSSVPAKTGTVGALNPSGTDSIGAFGGNTDFLTGQISEIAMLSYVADVSQVARAFIYDANRFATASQ